MKEKIYDIQKEMNTFEDEESEQFLHLMIEHSNALHDIFWSDDWKLASEVLQHFDVANDQVDLLYGATIDYNNALCKLSRDGRWEEDDIVKLLETWHAHYGEFVKRFKGEIMDSSLKNLGNIEDNGLAGLLGGFGLFC